MDGRGGGEEDAFALAARLGLPAATAAASRGPPPPTAAALEERFRRLQDDLMRRRVEKLKPPPTAPVTDEELRLRFQRLTQSNTPNGAFTQSSAAPSSSVHAPPLPLPPTPMDAESLMRSLAPAAGPRAPLPVGPGHPPRSAVADANAAFNEDAAVRRLLEQTRDSITIQRRPDCGPRSPAAAQGTGPWTRSSRRCWPAGTTQTRTSPWTLAPRLPLRHHLHPPMISRIRNGSAGSGRRRVHGNARGGRTHL